ncbi:MAG: HD-GYP domain-containing protein, partial [Lachnospiraceae bacterium]|nr:HD-GYP domain-containing protein [Lachnospiraceae bacterium]
EYSVLIAENYGFTKEETENLRKAALLHDIGKIAIPDEILNKPSKLSDKEYEIMKSHVTKGAEILQGFTLVENADLGAKYHHEKYDGTGYPDGLKGIDIPLYGRIIAIADAFDAMTANRIYRKRMPFSQVMSELRNNRGKQFDPQLLDVFINLIDEGKIDIKALYADAEGGDEQ